jgi:hypothetical protein
MNVHEIDLETEIARVRGELFAFRDRCLPTFFGRGGLIDPMPELGGPQWLELHEWRRAVDRLIEALPGAECSGRLDLGVFAFIHETCDPGFSIKDGRVVWRCGVGVMIISEEIAESTLIGMGKKLHLGESALQSLVDGLPEVERWLLGLPVEGSELHNILCTTLPLLVDADPEFVGRALDPETWRGIVLDRTGLTPRERAAELALVDSDFFRNVLNNSLLHVMGGAANNRFGLILELLGHRDLRGGYTDLFPHYCLAVLLAKVRAIRGLAGLDGDSRPVELRLVGFDPRFSEV